MNLPGRVAIITGASRGIGRDVAVNWAKCGVNIALFSRNQAALAQLTNELQSQNNNGAILSYVCDVRNVENIVDNISDIIAKFGKIDILFNNAGILYRGTSELKRNELQAMIDTNLIGAYNLVSVVVPYMKKQRSGHIFNMASNAAKIADTRFGGYSMTKFGLLGYSEALHKELAKYNIKVTALCPGTVNTDMTRAFSPEDKDKIPIDDIIKTLNYLLSLSDNSCVSEVIMRCKANVLKRYHE